MSTITFKNSLFALNDLDEFILIGLGDSGSTFQEKMSNKEIVQEYIVDLEFPIPKEADAYGVYRGDLKIAFSKCWTDCGYEYDSDVEIDNITLFSEI